MSQPQEVYKVDWIGKESDMIYSRMESTKEAAIKFQADLPEAIVTRLSKASEKAFRWQIVPTTMGKDLVSLIEARRKLMREGKLVNRAGISDLGLRTLPEFKKSQRARLIGMTVVSGVTIYAGTRKDLPMWLRISLFAVAAGTLYINGANYLSNRKIIKENTSK